MRRPPDLPRLLAISPALEPPLARWGEWLEVLAAAGVEATQLRDRGLPDRNLYELAVLARRILARPRLLWINSRPDVAAAAGADGVQLPARGLPVAAVRRAFGDRLLVGRSTHSLEEVRAAEREGADLVIFGPVWATPGKTPIGVEALREAASASVPVYAVGGVSVERLPEVAASGAAGAAAIRLFQDSEAARAAVQAAGECFGRAER